MGHVSEMMTAEVFLPQAGAVNETGTVPRVEEQNDDIDFPSVDEAFNVFINDWSSVQDEDVGTLVNNTLHGEGNRATSRFGFAAADDDDAAAAATDAADAAAAND